MEIAIIAVLVVMIIAFMIAWSIREKTIVLLHTRVRMLTEDKEKLEASIPLQRADAIRQSRATHAGLVTQDIAPLLPDWPYDLKDTRQVGAPLDYLAFVGMEAGDIEKIVFVEVKTGGARMSQRQRQIKKVIEQKKVEYLVHVPKPASTEAA